MNTPIVEVEIGGNHDQVVYVTSNDECFCCTACCCMAWAVIFTIFLIFSISSMIWAITSVSAQNQGIKCYYSLSSIIVDLILIFVFCKCAKQKKAQHLGGNV